MILVIASLALSLQGAFALGLPPSHTYYIPFPEDNQIAGFTAINAAAVNPMAVFVTISTVSENTVIYYDHWEDGYETDITNPTQSTTLVYGDGNPANGFPPGNPGDLLVAGTTFNLRNFVDSTTLQSVVDFDARDRVSSFKPISLTKTTFPTSTATLLAGCVEIFEQGLWGTDYRVPVGVDMPTTTPTATLTNDTDIFSYSALSIMAGNTPATVQIDADNNGIFEQTVNLGQGQSTYVTGVNTGARVTSDQPVQVIYFSGRPTSNYQSRDTSLLPVNRWSSSYYAPVSTVATNGTTVFLYNPGASPITVSYDYRSSTSAYTTATVSVPAGGNARVNLSPANGTTHFGAYHFYTTGASPPTFYAICAVDASDAATGNNQAYDGGSTLVGQPSLTTQVLLSLGVGRDPYSTVNPNENGNPLWITTVGNGHTPATVYVDYNGDNVGALTDPNGNHYDISYSLRELQQQQILDPDGDQTGMLVYSLDPAVKIAAIWAQNPSLATAGAPGFDVATLVPPLREGEAAKRSNLIVDNGGDGFTSAGDTLEIDIRCINSSRTNIPGPFRVTDNLPSDLVYVPGSTIYRFSVGNVWQAWTAIPDDPSGTAFPLDGIGYLISGTINYGQQIQVKFQASVKPAGQLSSERITNTGNIEISPYGLVVQLGWTDVIYGSIGDRVWNDIDGDGIQDPGEAGIAGVTVYADLNNNSIKDANEPSSVTDASGSYLLGQLVSGSYVIRVDAASVAAVNVQYGPTYDLDGAATSYVATASLQIAEDRRDVDFGFRTAASFGDRVWLDRDNDGVQETGEPGINGVRVYVDTNANNSYDVGEPNSFTFGDGTYYIGNLTTGSKDVRVDTTTLPAGLTQTYDLDGLGSTHEATVNLTTVHNPNLDFGYRGSFSIGDLVWYDIDNGGTQSATVYNVVNGRIDINSSGGTDANDDGFIGAYTIIDGYVDMDGSGTITAADTGTFQGYNVIAGGLDTNSSGTITNTDDATGVIRLEYGIPNVRVYIDADGDGVFDANEAFAITSALGAYSITNLPNGTYTVRVDTTTLPSSYAQTYDLTSPVTDHSATVVVNSANRTDVDFGYRDDASIGDFVWNDMDGDGVQDAGEPGIPGVLVYLDTTNNNNFDFGTERYAITDANGYYLINNLSSGTFEVRVEIGTLPSGSTQTYDLDTPATSANAANRTLTNAENATNVDFGYRSTASLGDRVWSDADGDGIQDAGETGLNGVRVFIDVNANGVYNPATEPAVLTAGDGNYTFSGLTAGVYSVMVDASTLPGGVIQSYDLNGVFDHRASVSLVSNQTRADADFGYTAPASIGDFVWLDANGNGQQDVGETGVSGVPVTLYRSSDDGIIATTTTNGSGAYSFANVIPGSYYVGFSLLNNYLFATANQGSDNTDSDVIPGSGKTAEFTLAPGQTNTTLDAGFIPASSIGNFVWVDANSNNIQDVGESGLAGVTVSLYRPGFGPDGIAGNGDDNNALSSMVTTASGAYSFGNLSMGTYQVGFGSLAGYARVGADIGSDDAVDSDAGQVSGLTGLIVLGFAENNATVDAGYSVVASIGDFVWSDTNGNGVQDGGESGLGGVTVNLYRPGFGADGIAGNGDDSAVVATTTSAAVTGAYSFIDLPFGTYQVEFGTATGYARSSADQGGNDATDSDANAVTGLTSSVVLLAGDVNNTIDAGLYPLGSIAGTVRVDVDGDGVVDPEDTAPLAGVTILLLDGSGGLLATTTTSLTGTYLFSDLPIGNFTVEQLLPTYYTNTYDVVPSNDRLIPRTLTAGQNSTGNDFYDTRPIAPTPQGKVLYLSDPSQALDRVDPVATNDATTAVTAALTPGTDTIAVVGAAASSNSGQTVSSHSFNYNSGSTGTNRILMVGISYRNQNSRVVNSATYAGQTMTQVGTINNGTNARVYIYQLLNPPTGSNSLAVTWNAALSQGAVIGAVTYSGVNQTTPTVNFNSATGSSNAPSVTITSTTGNLVFGVVGGRTTSDYAVTTGGTSLWTARPFSGSTSGSGQSEAGAASVNLTWTGSNTTWAAAGVSLQPAPTPVSTSFTQAPAFAMPFGLTSGTSISTIAHVEILSGSMPANPAITAVLSVNGTPFLTVSNPSYAGGVLTWTANLPSNVNITTGQAITLNISTLQTGVSFRVRHDSTTYPSRIILPTTSIIAIPSFEVFDAPYPGGSVLINPSVTDTRYVRIKVSDPFGASDITSVGLAIDGPGVTGDLNVNLGGAQVVVSDAWSKTYEYAWQTIALGGTYNLTATANEGTEGITATGNISDILYASAIGDFVFNDVNANGQQDGGEGGLGGVTVNLYRPGVGPDGIPGNGDDANVVATTTSAAVTGAYGFGNLPNGPYQVSFGALAGYNRTLADQGSDVTDSDANVTTGLAPQVTLGVGETNNTFDAGYYQPVTIGDFVFNDANANGQQDVGETGLNGVTVTLYRPGFGPDGIAGNGDDATAVTSTTTAGGGAYSFTSLPPGTYQVNFGPLTGYNRTLADQGADATDSDANASTGQTGNIVLAAGTTNNTIDAGFYQPVTIGDFVFNDANANGQQDVGETGLNGVTVTLYRPGYGPDGVAGNGDDATAVTSTTTAGGGAYSFTGLRPGTYQVNFGTLSGYSRTLADQGADATDSDANASTGQTGNIVLAAGTTNNTIDAGYYQPVTIGDFVFNDANANGQQDVGETGLNGVTVTLYRPGFGPDGIAGNGDDATAVTSTSTAGGGAYSFTGLRPGTYQVNFGTLAGYSRTLADQGADATDSDANASTGQTGNIVLAAGTTNNTIDAGYFQPVTIGDFVFNDANANGQQDVGETGLNGVTVTLYRPGFGPDGIAGNGDDSTAVTSTTTAGGGAYSFTGLRPGTYQVNFGTLSGYTRTLADQGADASDSDANAGTGQTANIVLAANATDNTIDAGYFQPASLGNFVFNDVNANGQQDVGETGLGGVTIDLYRPGFGPDGIAGNTDDATIVATTTSTAVTGAYSFTGLRPGTYNVQFGTLSGYTRTLANNGADASDSDANAGTGLVSSVVLAANTTDNTVDAGYFQASALGNFVFNDVNANGQQDVGETGLGGVTIDLYRPGFGPDGIAGNADDATIVATTTSTAVTGAYSFTGLRPGTYNVQFGTLSGYARTFANIGADATDSDAIAGTGLVSSVVLPANTTDNSVDAGYFQSVTIGDFVFNDANANGQQDVGETGLNGVTVTLYRPGFGPDGIAGNGDDATAVTSTTTAGGGAYSFTSLPPGTYQVNFGTLSGYNRTLADQGADATDSDANASTGQTGNIVQTAGTTNNTIDAGYYQPGSIAGSVLADTDNNNTGDAPIAGVTVRLFQGATELATTTTAANGSYLFSNLPPGNYTVVETQPSGYSSVSDVDGGNLDINGDVTPISVSAGQAVTGQDFVEEQPGAISGSVTADTDNNNAGDLALEGVVLTLLNGDGSVYDSDANTAGIQSLTTTTASDGTYGFTNLSPGTYGVAETQPAGYVSLSDKDGGNLDEIRPITVTAGATNTANDFVEMSRCPDTWADWKQLHPSETASGNPDADSYVNFTEFAFAMPYDGGVGSQWLNHTAWIIRESTTAPGTIEGVFIRPTGAYLNVVYKLQYAATTGNPTSWQAQEIVIDTGVSGNATAVANGDCTETVTIHGLETLTGLTGGTGVVRIKAELDDNGGNNEVNLTTYVESEGWTRTGLAGTCQTYNIPYVRESVFTGTVSSVSGQNLVFSGQDLTSLLVPGTSYYLEVTSGDHEGQRYDVSAASGANVTLASDDVIYSAAPYNNTAGAPPSTLAGDTVAIRRHWTLGEIFPVTDFKASDVPATSDEVQIFANGAWTTYWIDNRGDSDPQTARWVLVGDGTLADQAGAVIPPGYGLFVTRRAAAMEVLSYGEIRTNKFIRPLQSGSNFVGGGYPVDQSPVGTGSRVMTRDVSFFGSRDFKTADSIFVWKGDANAASSGYETYYLLYATSPYPNTLKWVRQGDASAASKDSVTLMLDDRAVFIRAKDNLPTYTIPSPWTP